MGKAMRKIGTLLGSMVASQSSAMQDTCNRRSAGGAGVHSLGHDSTEMMWMTNYSSREHIKAGTESLAGGSGDQA